jgi:uncharacterized phiE125 gp8 family phage protein
MPWYPLTVTTPAASEPITLADAKARCRIDDNASDEVVNALIAAARSHVEAYTGLRLIKQTISAKCDCFDDLYLLPFGPVQTVLSIAYVDLDGADQTLATSVYEVRVDGLEASVVLKYGQAWPSILPGSRITVMAEIGFDKVPESITIAMMYAIATWNEHREHIVVGQTAFELPGSAGFDALLCNFRLGV